MKLQKFEKYIFIKNIFYFFSNWAVHLVPTCKILNLSNNNLEIEPREDKYLLCLAVTSEQASGKRQVSCFKIVEKASHLTRHEFVFTKSRLIAEWLSDRSFFPQQIGKKLVVHEHECRGRSGLQETRRQALVEPWKMWLIKASGISETRRKKFLIADFCCVAFNRENGKHQIKLTQFSGSWNEGNLVF